uniref:Cytochrome P450 n=1 Tax=Kalanchoe fedtschenkoi TaxID=63787 RepID=A0A7N0RAE5_KALFE
MQSLNLLQNLPISITTLLLLLIVPFLLLLLLAARNGSSSSSSAQPKSYPLIGMEIARHRNTSNRLQWTTQILKSTPTLTFTFRRSFLFPSLIVTANPANVRHILKTSFNSYQKGPVFRTVFYDFLGHGIFNADGENWKFQRQVASHEFTTKSLRKFILTVVDAELRGRLKPLLTAAAEQSSVLDLQDVLQRFAFDNICQIAFGYDPAYLSPDDLPQTEFAVAFEHSALLTSLRSLAIFPTWRLKKILRLGSEKELSNDVASIRELARKIVREKKAELQKRLSLSSSQAAVDSGDEDLLSRFLSSGHSDEDFMVDIVISFILAGRDTTSVALTWFFWLLYKHPQVEAEILNEVVEKSDLNSFEEARDMTYAHAALYESMRFYPPVPTDGKHAMQDDVLPDGTVVKKGMSVTYHPYAMGRMEELWGADWEEFKPERWLQRDETTGKVRLVNVDSYKYPVFQAGPRICLGKDMAFLQMKRVVAAVLSDFKVIPVVEGFAPEFIAQLTGKMKGGFPVRVEKRTT